jgi:protein-disulfide isomerase
VEKNLHGLNHQESTLTEAVPVLVIHRRPSKLVVLVAIIIVLDIALGVMIYRLLADASRNEDQGPLKFDVSVDDDPALGPADAAIVMIEFSDFQCLYCASFARETFYPLMQTYEGQIQFVYRDFPILGDVSMMAAIAGECANEQGAFWTYHDLLFKNLKGLDRERFISLADSIDLNVEQFTNCLDDPAFRDEVDADLAAAKELGLRGTPTFFINGRLVAGDRPVDMFVKIIDEELALATANLEQPSNQ